MASRSTTKRTNSIKHSTLPTLLTYGRRHLLTGTNSPIKKPSPCEAAFDVVKDWDKNNYHSLSPNVHTFLSKIFLYKLNIFVRNAWL